MIDDLTAFLTAKRAAGLSPATLRWYEQFIRRYVAWSASTQLPNKKPETVEAWLASLREQMLSAFTISGCYRCLSVYFKWLVERGRLRTSPMTHIQPPRVPKQRKRHVTAAAFRRLYKSIDGDGWLDARDRAMLLILMYSGLRANELLGLKLEHIDEAAGVLRVVAGKGRIDRDVPFTSGVPDQMRLYLAHRPACAFQRAFVAAGKTPREVAGPLTYSGLTQMVRRRCAAAGIPRINLHSFRHGYAMLFLNEGEMELGLVSQTMGHSSVDITRRFYADYATTTMRERYNEAIRRLESLP